MNNGGNAVSNTHFSDAKVGSDRKDEEKSGRRNGFKRLAKIGSLSPF
jgi:hypothetical protein